MRINWKVLLAVALIGATALWAFTSLRAESHAGTALEFKVGRGPVTVTNPSDTPVSVQLAGTGARSFRVASTTEGMAGASTREGTGNTQSQLFHAVLPAGVSTFTVTGGSNVTFLSAADTRLSATVQPVSQSEAQTTLIASGVVILASLFFIWRATGHSWMSASRRQRAADLLARQTAENADPAYGQGREIRSYGDNRAEVGG